MMLSGNGSRQRSRSIIDMRRKESRTGYPAFLSKFVVTGGRFHEKVLIGGFLSIIGSIWALAMALVVENNLASSWSTPPGRLLTTVQEMGLMALFPAAVFLVAVFLVIFGIFILLAELLRKEK